MKFIKILLVNLIVLAFLAAGIFVTGEIYLRMTLDFEKGGATAIGLQIFETAEDYAWTHKAGAVDYQGYGEPTPEIKINNYGFRDDEIEMPKPENVKRILVLGDSFTFGMGMNKSEIYTEVLESKLNAQNDEFKYEVINMGSIGYTIDNQYLLLRDKGMMLDPDMVIIGFFAGNDVTELSRHELFYENDLLVKIEDTKHYVDEENRLRYFGQEEPTSYFLNFLEKRLIVMQKKLGTYEDPAGEPTLTWPAFLAVDDPNGNPKLPEYWQVFDELLGELKYTLDAFDIEMRVVAIPMDVQTNTKFWNKYAAMYFDQEAYDLSRPQAKMLELTTKYEIDFIDLLPYFRSANENIWYYFENEDPHWTAEGHAFAADVIYKNLNL